MLAKSVERGGFEPEVSSIRILLDCLNKAPQKLNVTTTRRRKKE